MECGVQYRRMGRSDLMTAEVGIGTRSALIDGIEAATATIEAAVAAGVTLIEVDIADERALEAMAGIVARSRNRLILVGCGDADAAAVTAALERLGTTRFDYFLDDGPDADSAAAQALAVEGLTRFAGLATDSPERALAAALDGGIDVVQLPFHALDPSLLQGAAAVLNAARAADIAVLGCSPLAGGELAKPEVDAALSFLGEEPPRTVPQALIAWALSEPRLSAVVCGPRTPSQATEAAEASRHAPLSEDAIAQVISAPPLS